MDPKAVVLILCLCAITIPFTEGGIPKCCTYLTKIKLSSQMLSKVAKWDMQQSNGACDIQALVLYYRDLDKPVCAHPKLKRRLLKAQLLHGANQTI